MCNDPTICHLCGDSVNYALDTTNDNTISYGNYHTCNITHTETQDLCIACGVHSFDFHIAGCPYAIYCNDCGYNENYNNYHYIHCKLSLFCDKCVIIFNNYDIINPEYIDWTLLCEECCIKHFN